MTDDYRLLTQQAKALLEAERDPLANAANLTALIFNSVARLNWVGFYFLKDEELVLGPFQGQVACTRIALGSGVCGTAFANSVTQRVADVHQFDGHIACDSASESELVVPFTSPVISGVLDIDSPEKGRFTAQEQDLFENLVTVYLSSIA